MDLPKDYTKRFHNDPASKKNRAGEPRSEREALLIQFRDRLNFSRETVGLAKLSDIRIAKMFEGYPTENLHQLFKECEAAKKFGGLLKFKLDDYRKKA